MDQFPLSLPLPPFVLPLEVSCQGPARSSSPWDQTQVAPFWQRPSKTNFHCVCEVGDWYPLPLPGCCCWYSPARAPMNPWCLCVMVFVDCALWWLLRSCCASVNSCRICGSSRVRAAATRSRVLASARCERSRRCQAGS